MLSTPHNQSIMIFIVHLNSSYLRVAYFMPLEIGLPGFFVIFLIICSPSLTTSQKFLLTKSQIYGPKAPISDPISNKILFGRQVMWFSSLTIGWKGSMKLLSDGKMLNISSFDIDALAEALLANWKDP
ncbi:MAG: hypothetical protein CML33_00205 [Rhodobacteraceae bacterium]|nr:hypothetical protein [Paracoccaceae bacterium]